MKTWVYIKSEPCLWTVGFYAPDGKWHTDSDHNTPEAAGRRAHYLNGGQPEPDPKDDCANQRCTYFTHYELYYSREVQGEKLGHQAYHEAEKRCARAQQNIEDWLDKHPDTNPDKSAQFAALEKQATFWEKKVAA